jgi:RsiW-degrading membrane proteinase PrsW (M82 family)
MVDQVSPYSHSPEPPPSDHPAAPDVPEYPEQGHQDPEFRLPGPPDGHWRYKPRRPFWENRTLRLAALFTLLALCGVIILSLVYRQTGTEGFLVGLFLAVLPVPLLIGSFLWLDRVEPMPGRSVVFAFAWGACAATLVAILANQLGTHLLTSAFTATRAEADSWEATFVAPLIEESAKGAAVLLLFVFRRRDFTGIVDGVVVAGLSATGFAFTENVLYLGSAFGEDQAYGNAYDGPVGLQTTAATFFVRVVMTPFAHPLFTSLTGIGFALAAVSRPGQVRRWLAPLGGWLLAMMLHGTWNGSADFSPLGFLAIYATLMIPLFACLVWLAVWSRFSELKTIRTQLPVYATAGWLTPLEPVALGSMKARSMARSTARHHHGEAAARTVREYQSFATSLAFLRARAARGAIGPDFAAREQELLHHLWQRKAVAQPALTHAAFTVHPPYPVYPAHPPYPAHPAFQPPGPYGSADNGYGNGYTNGRGTDWQQQRYTAYHPTRHQPRHQPYQPPYPR